MTKHMKKNLFTIIFLATVSLTFAQTQLDTLNVNPTNVTLSWNDGTGSNECTNANYLLRYKESSSSTWLTAIIIPNNLGSQLYILNGLNTSTTYNWRIKCGSSGSWEYGPNFTTRFDSSKIMKLQATIKISITLNQK